MASQHDDQQTVVWAILTGVVILTIGLLIGVGLYETGTPADEPLGKSPALSASGDLTLEAMTRVDAARMAAAGLQGGGSEAVSPASDAGAARVEVRDEVVTFYFASGQSELPAGTPEALNDIVRAVAAGRTAVISGYHDTTGGALQNEQLARERAFAVRDALMDVGIGEDKLLLRRPQVAAGGSDASARRVEVTLE